MASSRSNKAESSTDHDRSHTHAHTNDSRISRIAGQLTGSIVSAPQYYRPRSHSTASRSSISSDHVHHSSHHERTAAERLMSVSRQLGGAVFAPSASASHRTINPHLSPHEAAKQWENLPRFRDLPREGGFPGCAWSVWGKGDQLGCLNLLTEAVRARAAKEEIRTGHSISLCWPLHLPIEPSFGRKAVTHTPWAKTSEYYTSRRSAAVHSRRVAGENVEDRSEQDNPQAAPVSEDEIHINPQSGTQWDGFSHFGHLSLNCFYQGHSRHSIQSRFDASGSSGSSSSSSNGSNGSSHHPLDPRDDDGPPLGIQAWARRGIQGRGVLLDVWGYLVRNNEGHDPYDAFTSHAITLDTLRECARAQGVRFRQGDILLIRTGTTLRYYNSTPSERSRFSTGTDGLVGLEQDELLLEWLWDHHFSAIASDAVALERWPCPLGSTHLHETLLALFGMPIGEWFDLEELTAHCQRTRRWTFHFSSWPLRNYGGVASTANAGATF